MTMNDQHEWAAKRVLVTGGAGFIGSHLVQNLAAAGAAITVLDTFSTGVRENLGHVAGTVNLQELDVRRVAWEEVVGVQHYEVIFHFAANAYVPPSVESPAYDYELNFESTFRLLEALRKLKWTGALIYASSAAVYGNPARVPVREDDPTVPVSPYGVGKLAAERYVAVFSRLYDIRAASLRLFSIYGPRQRKQVVYDLIERIIQSSTELFIHGDGSQVRDLTYVEDTVRAAMLVAERAPLHGEVYNVGSGQDCTIGQLAEALCYLLGKPLRFAYSGAVRPGDPEKLSVDISRVAELGYRPRVSLEEGLRRTVEWYLDANVASLQAQAVAI
jgi:UDP-glucose 4-epimerase